MSTTPNLGLTLPAHGATGWDTPLNGNFTLIDALGGGVAGEALTSNGPNTTPTFQAPKIVRNPQTATPYAIQNSDRGKWITCSFATAFAVTIAQAGAGGLFTDGWYCYIQCIGAGTVTVTPNISTINGGANITRTTSQAAIILSDGTNYQAFLSA